MTPNEIEKAIIDSVPENMNIAAIKELQGRELRDFVSGYQQLMLLYESAMKQIITKVEILSQDYRMRGERSPIEAVKSRLKSPQSVADKLRRYEFEMEIDSIRENLNDVAGVRVVCSYISDIYMVRDTLLSQADVTLVSEKDYIKTPKENGYRSLHLVIEMPVYLAYNVHTVKVEIQIRTIAMDFWASLEHNIRYKADDDIPSGVTRELCECAEVIARTDRRMEEIASKLNQI